MDSIVNIAAQNNIRVLLVDPSPGECQLVGKLLDAVDHIDYQLSCCDELSSALPKMLSNDYDVILLDYLWRGEGCRDLLSEARIQGCTAPILVMTDSLEVDLDREAISLGASDYVIKGDLNSLVLERTIRYAIERKSTELDLSRLAHFDPLTHIPNRILFRDRLEHAIALSKREKKSFALMFLDLDGFKQVNDVHGHEVGDSLIRGCAERLVACLRNSDSVARIGGDEFTLLLEDTDSSSDLAHIAEKIIQIIATPYDLGRVQVSVGCSIGIALYPSAGNTADELMHNADMAMYRAKKEEGGSYTFFTEKMNIESRKRLHLEADLRRSLRKQEFQLQYQPRVDLRSSNISSVEALVRWKHPLRGLLPPSEFLSVAEDCGVIVELGYWVVRRVCLDLILLKQRGLSPAPVAINLSARQFNDPRLVERIGKILHETGVDGRELEFELSETVLMENIEGVELCMLALAHLGISFSLDDFGTSSSSFTALQRLPIGSLMIDHSFIASMTSTDMNTKLVAAMITLGHSLDKVVMAEGVETEQQQELLEYFGCDMVQGFHIKRPMSLAEFHDFLRDTRAERSSDSISESMIFKII